MELSPATPVRSERESISITKFVLPHSEGKRTFLLASRKDEELYQEIVQLYHQKVAENYGPDLANSESISKQIRWSEKDIVEVKEKFCKLYYPLMRSLDANLLHLHLFVDRRDNADAIINSVFGLQKFDFVIKHVMKSKGGESGGGGGGAGVSGNDLQQLNNDRHEKHERQNEGIRLAFEKELLREGLFIEREESTIVTLKLEKQNGIRTVVQLEKHVTFIKIFVPFRRLKLQARNMKMKFALEEKDRDMVELKRQKEKKIFLFIKHRLIELFQEPVDVESVFAPFKGDESIFKGGNESRRYFVDIVDNFFSSAKRQLMANHIIHHARVPFINEHGRHVWYLFSKIMHRGIYSDYLLPHDGPYSVPSNELMGNRDKYTRAVLYKDWALSFFTPQPIELIRFYYGEKIAIYFAWLGFYTMWLFFAAVVGLVCFIFSLIKSLKQARDPSNSGGAIPFISMVFDNELNIFFAMFISLWACLFQEFWKRKAAILAFNWDVVNIEESDMPRAEFFGTRIRISPVTGKKELHYPNVVRSFKLLSSCLVVLVSGAIVIASLAATIILRSVFSSNGSITILVAILNLVVIYILGFAYQIIAVKLTNWENHRTDSEHENALISKIFVFDFINYYSSLFYLAFFKGAYGHAILGNRSWNDLCSDSCIADLMVQLAIVFGGKQFINQFAEVFVPWLMDFINRRMADKRGSNGSGSGGKESDEKRELIRDFEMVPYTSVSDDFKEMTIQFGFATLFTVAFPIAPLFAFLNNFLEIRTDAYKLTRECRRPVALAASNIGVWLNILKTMTSLSVITNGFLIGFSSEWVKNNLIIPNLSAENVNNEQAILGGRIVIVMVFEHIVFLAQFIASYLVADVPGNVKTALERQAYRVSLSNGGEAAVDADENDVVLMDKVCCC